MCEANDRLCKILFSQLAKMARSNVKDGLRIRTETTH